MSFTDQNVAEVRHVVQKILVPGIFIVGLLGNSVSIYVLTRKRMRCTTNLYLTALAITDLMYLTMALLLSLQHYQYTHLNWPSYWTYIGIVLWLCDACAYISIYIAVSFTIERFIAIRYPLRRQTFCTESLAKKVIAGVSVFCLVSTISTAFEHQQKVDYRFLDPFGNPCNETLSLMIEKQQQHLHQLRYHHQHPTEALPIEQHSTEFIGFRDEHFKGLTTTFHFNVTSETPQKNTVVGSIGETSFKMINSSNNYNKSSNNHKVAIMQNQSQLAEKMDTKTFQEKYDTVHTPILLEDQQRLSLRDIVSNADDHLHHSGLDFNEFCQNMSYYGHEPSALGNNAIYLELWYFFTLFVFVLLPLCVLLTFNLFLILLVRRSKTLRSEMTNANSMRRTCKRKISMAPVSQENRITVTLIAVVLLFIVCQLPWAIYLIISNQIEIDLNLQIIIGNIFNFLTALNAAGNFFLYCVLSDKYRRTIRELLTGHRHRPKRFNLNSVSAYTNSSRRSARPSTPSPMINR